MAAAEAHATVPEDELVMLTTRVPRSLMEALDAAAREHGTSRSDLVRAGSTAAVADLDAVRRTALGRDLSGMTRRLLSTPPTPYTESKVT